MYTFLRSIPARELMLAQLPAFTTAFLIAEFFYKFHSFALECLAFLATWFVIDAIITAVRTLWSVRTGPG